MSKGLEALKLLGEMPKALSIGCETTLKVFCAKEFSIIEKELKDLEFLKELFKSIVTMKENGFPIVELRCNKKIMKKLKEVIL